MPETAILLQKYCKRGYFRWGKTSRKCWQDISRAGNFNEFTHISFIKAYEFYFRVVVIFPTNTKARKTRKIPLRENFHVYSKLGASRGQKGHRGGQKGAREGKKGAREGKKGAAPFYFGLAGTLTIYFWKTYSRNNHFKTKIVKIG